MTQEQKFMGKCMELAKKARMHVSPNPMVGAVIVKNGQEISSANHEFFGGPHAEALAIKKAGKKARGATLFVNLEPCCHFGKQPPCTREIIRAGIKKVVIAAKDPNPLVNGKGIRELEKNGVKVRTGVLQKEAVELNEKFFKYQKTSKPFVLIKNAVSTDGKISTQDKKQKISSKQSIRKVMELRAEFDAILVGKNTVAMDNPRLTSRVKGAKNPLRIIIASKADIAPDSKVLDNSAPTIIVCTKKAGKKAIEKMVQMNAGIVCAKEKNGRVDLKNALEQIGKMGISSVLAEGGAQITSTLLKEKLFDKMILVISPKITGKGKDFLTDRKLINKLELKKIEFFGNDAWTTFYPRKR